MRSAPRDAKKRTRIWAVRLSHDGHVVMHALRRQLNELKEKRNTVDRKAQTTAEASATSNVAPRVLEVGAATPAPARRKMRQDAAEGVGAVDGDALAGEARGLGRHSDERAGLSATGACCGSSGRLEMPEQAGAGQRIAVQLQAASEATGRGLSGGLQRLLVSNAGRLLPQVGRQHEGTAGVSMASDAAHGTAHAVHAELHAVHASDRGDIGFEDEGLSRNQRRRRRQKAGRAPGRAPVAAGSLPTEDQAAAEAPSSERAIPHRNAQGVKDTMSIL